MSDFWKDTNVNTKRGVITKTFGLLNTPFGLRISWSFHLAKRHTYVFWLCYIHVLFTRQFVFHIRPYNYSHFRTCRNIYIYNIYIYIYDTKNCFPAIDNVLMFCIGCDFIHIILKIYDKILVCIEYIRMIPYNFSLWQDILRSVYCIIAESVHDGKD